MPLPPPTPRGLPSGLRRMLTAFMWSLALEDTEVAPAGGERADGTLVGVGASPGSYTGSVRAIRSEAELSRLETGEVLVCPTTHSSWAVAFGRAGALVTDRGGMLSHASIIAREYGIQAVVATGDATSSLRDGQLVTVDGAEGRVTVVEPE